MNDSDDLFEYLLNISDQIDVETEMAQIAEQSMVELKHDEFMPIFDEFYGSRVVDQFAFEVKALKKPLRDPKGGLTAAGRAYFKRTEGANLKPGVRGPANTPEKMRRKGSFLTRFFTNPSGPMKDDKGRATRLALSAAAWGEPVPQNAQDAAKLAAKGRRLLERYAKTKKKDFADDILMKSLNGQLDPLTESDLYGINIKGSVIEESDEDTDARLVRREVTREELLMRNIRLRNKAVNSVRGAGDRFENFLSHAARSRNGKNVNRRSRGKKLGNSR